MKWYFAINEDGSGGQTGMHAKLAVLSARRNTTLDPHLVYSGQENDFTRWMTDHGVTVRRINLTFEAEIHALARAGLYSATYLGHWLRTAVCLLNREDRFVVYTDCDVVFLREPDFGGVGPDRFACAPEFRRDGANYFNSGVMVMNLPALRRDYPDFERFILEKMRTIGANFRDQYAYNLYYRGRWDRLDPRLNWKPYWGADDAASVLHFHGPKCHSIGAILGRSWNWGTGHGRQIGSLFAGHLPGYLWALRATLAAIGEDHPDERGPVEALLRDAAAWAPDQADGPIDLGFMDFRLFPEQIPVSAV
jgi:Glycosyl transferase family 8